MSEADNRAAREGAAEPGSFRAHARDWLAANFPLSLKGGSAVMLAHGDAPPGPDYDLWRERIGAIGWGVPSWPAEYGGGGLSADEADVLAEEMARAGAFNPIAGLGVMMLGPTVLEFGTHAQKLEHIPPIARGELRWCQGFSEPGAGSDLASLQTRCEDRGDHWLVNGQKIWTSFAHLADWCFCLVRTDTTRKQGGISFLLIDMRTPGVEARPIKLINGVSHFCETFLTDVRVPKDNLLGEVNAGWTIAKRLLQHERSGLSANRAVARDLADIAREYVSVDEQGRLADPDLRARLTDHLMTARAYALTLRRRAAEAEAGRPPTTALSVLKNLGARIAQDRGELGVEILGHNGLGWDGEGYDRAELGLVSEWLYSKCYSIYGGSHEIQNNITAKRVLELPGG
jgi:acyl-CoA dehydrogenase